MNEKNIFSKIINKEIFADIIYQDKLVTAFRDITPKAPVHILIVTNAFIPTVNDITSKHEKMLGRLFIVAAKISKQEGIHNDGYRLVVNCNKHGCQEIYHLHMHLLGGKQLSSKIT